MINPIGSRLLSVSLSTPSACSSIALVAPACLVFFAACPSCVGSRQKKSALLSPAQAELSFEALQKVGD